MPGWVSSQFLCSLLYLESGDIRSNKAENDAVPGKVLLVTNVALANVHNYIASIREQL